MPVRPATPADVAFIRRIAGRIDNARFIADEPDAKILAHMQAPDREVVIWSRDGNRLGFGLFAEIGDPSGRIELRRLGLNRIDGGLGRVFINELTDYAFDRLQAQRLWLDAVLENTRAQAVYDRAGFAREGIQRRHWKRPCGDVSDLVLFGMLREEWEALRAASGEVSV
ncbi:MAG: GNAT family N-acetyltransferase [Pelagimonas sp.]